MDKKTCQDYWAAKACDGNAYNNNMKNASKRKDAAADMVKKHPECKSFVTEHTSCAIINPAKGGGRRKATRKGRKGRKGTRKGTRRN